jgi:hypothetical protein
VVVPYDCHKLADCAGMQAQIRQLVERYSKWRDRGPERTED